jgi:hypothetical protein
LTQRIVPLDFSPLPQDLKALALAASEVLDRDPAPTLSLDELVARLEEAGTVRVPPLDALLKALVAHPDHLRVLRRPEWGWPAEFGPVAWVVATNLLTRDHSRQSLPERLRSTVISLSHQVEPNSMLSWARWNSIVLEERRVRRGLLMSSTH